MPPSPPTNPDVADVDYFGETARQLAKQCIDDCAADSSRVQRHKSDWLNLLFDRGGEDNHWVTWDQVSDAWVRIPYEGDYGLPPEVPRACTNVFSNKIDGVAGILNQSEPAQEWRPSSDDDEDLATAAVCEDIIPTLWDELGYPELKPVLNKAVTLIDKAFFVIHYDPDPKHGESMVQAYRCTSCDKMSLPMDVQDAGDTCPGCGAAANPTCAACGETSTDPDAETCEDCGGAVGGGMEAAVDSQFNPIGVNYPVGKLEGEMLTSFEGSLPAYAKSPYVEDNAFFVAHQRYSESEFIATWGQEHKDLVTKSSNAGSGGQTSQQYADALRSLNSPHTVGNAGRVQGPLVQRVWHDPIDTEEFHFPDGLYVALCGDTIIDAGPLPIHDDNQRAIKPIITRIFRRQVGTASGKPPADDLVPLQRMRNLWETVLAMRGLRYAMPTTWVPTTVTIETPSTGMPQGERYYRSHDGQRPTVEQVDAGSQAVYENIDRIDKKMDELSNLNSILQGDRPAGDPTLGEVQRLEDRAFGQFRTALEELTRFEKNLSILALRFARETFWAPRIAKIRGDNDQWEISKFTNADLGGNVDVYVNAVSAWPKSQLMQQLRLQKAVEMGILIPQSDPELQVKVLSDWNLSHLKTSLDADRKQIARELDRWKSAQDPQQIPPPDPPPVINPQMHLHYKTQFLKTETAEDIRKQNPPVWQAMLAHVQALQQMAQPPAPPPEAAPPEQPKGPDGSALHTAIDTGAIKPKPHTSVPDLVDAGVLHPAGPANGGPPTSGPGAKPASPNTSARTH